MRTYATLFILWTFLLLTACQPTSVSTSISVEITPSETAELIFPTQTMEHMTPVPSIPTDPELQNLIELITQDLAARLGVSPADISLVEATPVEWSDSSLDCPEEGMGYLQVITPGYRIVLQANNQPYEYHTNRAGYFILCNNRTPQ